MGSLELLVIIVLMNNVVITWVGGLIPLFTGFIWYSDKVLGKAWKKEIGFIETGEAPKGMMKLFIFSYLFGVLIMFFLPSVVIHQYHMSSTLVGTEGFGVAGSPVQQYFTDFMSVYGNRYRTFQHGALHGVIAALFFSFPLIGLSALFEKKSFKYIFIHVGYWAISLGIMGGVTCAFYQLHH